ncbi:MAG: nickel-dependent hydrogenase large subunit [bacterium]
MLADEFITKIEGHGSLTIDWKNGKVKLNIHEGERLFEGLLVGRTADEMHWITPRICGVCPTAHNLASLNALENALGIKPTKTTVQLRNLMTCGQMIQSHVLHLFFLVAPDYLGIDRATELAKKDIKLFKQILSLKEVSDGIVHLAGGRNVHPTKTTIGGFHKVPSQQLLKQLLNKLEKTTEAARTAMNIMLSFDYPELKVDLELVAQDRRSILSVNSADISCRSRESGNLENEDISIINKSSIKDYKKDIQEEIRSYSTAKFSKYKNKAMFVGSLARVALNQKDFGKYKLDFENPFHNNIAQAVELLHYHQQAKEIIEKLLNKKLEKQIIKPSKNPSLKGIGTSEAPRGSLYHEVYLRSNKGGDSVIKYANIITPTAQNLTSIEKSARALLEQTGKLSKEKREKLLVMLVRAYDPCITCSVH